MDTITIEEAREKLKTCTRKEKTRRNGVLEIWWYDSNDKIVADGTFDLSYSCIYFGGTGPKITGKDADELKSLGTLRE
jgi:hypothetical protein